jgi:signal transduction histidine kinase
MHIRIPLGSVIVALCGAVAAHMLGERAAALRLALCVATVLFGLILAFSDARGRVGASRAAISLKDSERGGPPDWLVNAYCAAATWTVLTIDLLMGGRVASYLFLPLVPLLAEALEPARSRGLAWISISSAAFAVARLLPSFFPGAFAGLGISEPLGIATRVFAGVSVGEEQVVQLANVVLAAVSATTASVLVRILGRSTAEETKRRQQWLDTLSHEVRQPLHALLASISEGSPG